MHSPLLLLSGLAAIFSGCAAVIVIIGLRAERPTAFRSLALLEGFTAAPEHMQQELQPRFADRVLTPLLNRLVGIGRRLTPSDYSTRVQRKLDVAGNPGGATADRIISLQALGFGAGLLLSVVLVATVGLSTVTAVLLGVAFSLAGYFGPVLWLHQKGFDRNQVVQRALPDTLDLLTISVEAGLGFNAAVSQVALNTEGPLAEELARVLQEMQIGLSRSQALRALAARSNLSELKEFVTAMVQADELGIPIGRVLRVQSVEMRVKRRQHAEELAQKVPVKILMPLIFCILPTLFIVVMGPGVIAIMAAFSGTL
jgi:tight adherence protein C